MCARIPCLSKLPSLRIVPSSYCLILEDRYRWFVSTVVQLSTILFVGFHRMGMRPIFSFFYKTKSTEATLLNNLTGAF